MKNFAIVGAAGFVAPRHFKAIKDTGNALLAAVDKHDSVGILDQYFPEAAFFTEFERFDRHVEKLKKIRAIDYFSICSPNYLHDAHIRFGLRYGADVICEKPIVLNPWNIDALIQVEKEFGKNIYTILQLRLHPSIIALKKMIEEGPKDKIYDVDLTYITARGNWYYASWKGDVSKSGGVATNIGIHFFDMLTWIFGEAKENLVNIHSHDRAGGFLQFEKARVRWFLSINESTLPQNCKESDQKTFRSLAINGEEFSFSEGFEDLHTKSYEKILNGFGYGAEESRKGIELVHDIRTKTIVGLKGDYHPLCKLPLTKHPFNS